MPFWEEPKPPPVEKMPRRRETPPGPKIGTRIVAALAGIAVGTSCLMGLSRALTDTSGQGSPFMSLALLLPTIMLFRYAITGKIKVN